MGSHTEEELQAMNMTALKALPESEGGRSLTKPKLIAYILNDTAANTAAEAEAEAIEASGEPQEGAAGTATFALPDEAQRRTVVVEIDGERRELEFYGGTYTTDDQDEVDALYAAKYNPVADETDDRPSKPKL